MTEGQAKKRTRTVRNFPAVPFKDAEDFTRSVFDIGGGQPVKRLTLFDQLGKSPDSGPSRALITNSNKYGLTKGGYNAEELALTDLGLQVSSDKVTEKQRQSGRINAAIVNIQPFNAVFETLIGNKLPPSAVLIDRMKEHGVTVDAAAEAVDTLILNMRDVGLLQTLSAAERVVSVQSRLDGIIEVSPLSAPATNYRGSASVITSSHASFETTAFYVTPIGQVGSPQRRHADMFSASIVEPAIEFTQLKLVRADQI